MQLQYQAYSQIATQLRLAEAKVQEDTPAFTTLQPAFVPLKKAGPKRLVICVLVLFLVFIIITIYVFNREKDLMPLFKFPEKESSPSINELIKVIFFEDLKK